MSRKGGEMIRDTAELQAWTVAPAGQIDPAGVMEGYRRLAFEVLQQAVRDAHSRGETARAARAWLARDGLQWFEMAGIGVQPGQFRAWLAALPTMKAPPLWRTSVISLFCEVIKSYGYDSEPN